MAKCEECGVEYWQAKPWQRFCNPKCRDDWHNHQRKLALVVEAEEMRELRLAKRVNGNGAALTDPKPLSDLLKSLRPAEPTRPLDRRV